MKALKVILKGLLWVIGLILVFFLLMFIYHKISNKIYEDKYYKVPGDLIEVYDNEFMHAKLIGSGEYTIVMLSGMGTPSPYYDFYNLIESLSKNNKVLIIEQLGYGYSSETEKNRTLENYTNEIDKVLNHFNITDNIVMLSHSYMGPITLNYSNNHDSVKGYVCLDCSSAYQVEKNVLDNEEFPKYPKYYSLMSPSGLTRLIGLIGGEELLNELYLSDIREEHKKDYEYFIYNRTLNKTIIKEMEDFPKIEKEMLNKKYKDNLYVITYLASDTIASMDEYYKEGDFLYSWNEMHEKLISNDEIQKIYVLNGDHYIHHGNTEVITNGINNMINTIE